ncbi:MAG TPA: NTP transferase domain-containing protein [Pirellulales bacterium]|jgi:spore coat polysaccharide biosynthesis protein SpsF
MATTLGVVEVRRTADVPFLTACRRLGGKSLLEWVVRRMTDSLRLDGVVVLCPDVPQAAELADIVPREVPLVIRPEADALGRLANALDEHPADAVVCVAAEHPFVDPELIDRLITTADHHPESDYIGFCSRTQKAAVMAPLGMIGEWIRSAAVRQSNLAAHDQHQRNHVASFVHAHPEQFQLRLIPVPQELDRDDLRLTIAGEEDWENVQAIFEALGPEQLDYQCIASLLDHQPALRQRMAALNRLVGAA